jgi:predicted transcriptional regulator
VPQLPPNQEDRTVVRADSPQTRREKKSPKRSKVELYATVLEVIKRYPEGVRITKMSYGVGVPIDRLKIILQDLGNYGLVQVLSDEDGSAYYALNPRSLEFLETYWKMRGYLEVFGESARDALM